MSEPQNPPAQSKKKKSTFKLFEVGDVPDPVEPLPPSLEKSILDFFSVKTPEPTGAKVEQSQSRKRKREPKHKPVIETPAGSKEDEIDELFDDTAEDTSPQKVTSDTKVKKGGKANRTKKQKTQDTKNKADEDSDDCTFVPDDDAITATTGKKRKLQAKEKIERYQKTFLDKMRNARARAGALINHCTNETKDVNSVLVPAARAGNILTNMKKILSSVDKSLMEKFKSELELSVDEWRENNMLLGMIDGDDAESTVDHVEKSEFAALNIEDQRALLATYVACVEFLPKLESMMSQLKFIVQNLSEKKRLGLRIVKDLENLRKYNTESTDSVLKVLEESTRNGNASFYNAAYGPPSSTGTNSVNVMPSLFRNGSASNEMAHQQQQIIPQGFQAMKRSVMSMPTTRA